MKNLLLGIIAFFGLLNADAQTTDPAAKSDLKLLFEKIYLHTDRNIYTPGDTLWFKAYLVNAQSNTAANSSATLNVDLINLDAKIISSELIRLNDGSGNGDFDLPDTLAAGTYRLRAYTNWMRNFGDNFIFEKEILLVSTESVAVAPAVVNLKKDNEIKTAGATANSYPATATNLRSPAIADVNFFPEGGSLVNGISGILGFKVEGGRSVSGTVISSPGDTVAHFSCDTSGFGIFMLLPLQGQNYRAEIKGITYPLPDALSSGLALQVHPEDSLIRLIVSQSDTTFKKAMLKVKHAGITVVSHQLEFAAAQIAARIPVAGLPEGICAITLYDDSGKPNCERLVYIHTTAKTKLTITTDKKVYQPKEKVTVNISAPAYTNLSIAVVDAEVAPERADDIVSYLMLSSEIKGTIEHAGQYFDTTNVNRFKQLDMLLLTQGWRDFVWRRLADTAIRINYAAENGIEVSGIVEDEVNHKPMPDVNVSLFANAAKGNKLFSGKTDAIGRFTFKGLIQYGNQNVKLTSFNNKGEKRGSFLVDTLVPLKVKPVLVYKSLQRLNKDLAAIYAIERRNAITEKANVKDVTKLKEVKVRGQQNVILKSGVSFTTLGYKDQIFDITRDDNQYKTLEWYLLQNAKGAQESSAVYNSIIPTGVEFVGVDTVPGAIRVKSVLMPPLIFVNGQELSMDENGQAENYRITYFNMPLNKFKKIVIRHLVGNIKNAFVDRYLLYLTMINNYMTDNPGSTEIDIPGYYLARTFYKPPPNTESMLTDYRSTIYWEPNIKTDAAGRARVSFYNTVVPGDVNITAQGLTDKGIPVVSATSYTVK